MQPLIGIAFLVPLVALAFAGMAWSWRRRRAAQTGYRLPQPPVGSMPDTASGDALYLATTFTGRPLDRVVVAGLGFRSSARVRVAADRVSIELAATTVVLPAASITGAGSATWTIDRTVEQGGLTVIGWTLDGPDGPAPVESSFRFAPGEAQAIVAAVEGIRAATKEGSS